MNRAWNVALVAVVASCMAATAHAQQPTREAFVAAARDIMLASRYCTMVTNGLDGQPQARVIDAFAPDSSLTIWIATKARSRKVEELRKDPRVTLQYFNTAAGEYATLFGTAVLITDAGERAAHWKPTWKSFYDDEWRGADYLLIQVRPKRIEVLSPARGFGNDPKTWRPRGVDLP